MENTGELVEKESERVAMAEEATRIVQAAEAQSRELTPAEDARVLQLMKQVRVLEEEIGRQKRHAVSASQ
jgi:hypothetical protein